MRMKLQFSIAALLVGFSLGCTSIKTTQVFRGADGKFSVCCLPRSSKGIPCKFKVETGISVSIHETIFVNLTDGKIVKSNRRLLAIKTKPIYSDQVFMVHVSRPLAGTLDMSDGKGYSFNNEGYLTGIKAKVEDTTIKDIATSLGKDSLGGILTAATKDDQKSLSIEAHERTIAVRDFSYADPHWNIEMNEWVQLYMECNVVCPPECLDTVSAAQSAPRVAMLQP